MSGPRQQPAFRRLFYSLPVQHNLDACFTVGRNHTNQRSCSFPSCDVAAARVVTLLRNQPVCSIRTRRVSNQFDNSINVFLFLQSLLTDFVPPLLPLVIPTLNFAGTQPS